MRRLFESVIERVIGSNVVDATKEFTIKVKAAPPPPPEEGRGTIMAVVAPSEFTPGDTITVEIAVGNNGATDSLFIRLKNKDTGVSLADKTVTVLENKSYGWLPSITITQTTDFHGIVEVGHIV